MVGLLLAGYILWLSSPLVMEFLEYMNGNVFSPIGEWIRNLLGLERDCHESAKPFVVSEYLARIEKASLDILESREPTDKIIILWWGLDGLRLNEDGSLEWVSRKRPEKAVFYQPRQTIRPDVFLMGPSAEHKGADRRADGTEHGLADSIMAKRANGEHTPAVLRTDCDAISTVLLWRVLWELS